MIYAFIVVLILMCPSLVWSQIAVDATSSGEGTTSTSHDHTFAPGSICIVCLGMRAADGAVTAVSTPPTVNGSNMTYIQGVTETGAGAMRVEMWYHLSPGTGLQTVAATYDASTTKALTQVISLTGTAASSTFGTASTGFAVSANADVNSIPSALNELGVSCAVARTNTTTFSADATAPTSAERLETSHTGASSFTSALYTEDGAATSIDMRTDISPSAQWAMVAVSVRPAVSTRHRDEESDE